MIVEEIVLAVTKEVNTKIFVENLTCCTTGSARRQNVTPVMMVKVQRTILPDLDNIDHSTTAG